MAGRGRDLLRLDALLEQPILLSEERDELYDIAHRRMVDVREKRLRMLLSQPALMADDLAELHRLCRELDVVVETVRHDFKEEKVWR